jgi:uncharacterized membrane protein (DUF2068 family)
MVEALKYYGISEEQQLRLDPVARWRQTIMLSAITFLVFSVASIIASYGMFRGKRWGLHLWYCLVGCFLIFHVIRAVIGYQDGYSEFVGRCFEILIVAIVAMITMVLIYTKGTPFSGVPSLPPEEWSNSHSADI